MYIIENVSILGTARNTVWADARPLRFNKLLCPVRLYGDEAETWFVKHDSDSDTDSPPKSGHPKIR